MDMARIKIIWSIYCLTCIVNGKRYVGQTKKNPPSLRWNKHFTRSERGGYGCIHLAQAIRKHGKARPIDGWPWEFKPR
jgi:hypothetical protein